MGNVKNVFKSTIAIFAIIFIFSIIKLVNLITDYWWFDNLGFSSIFMISLKTKLAIFVLAGLFFFTFAIINLSISSKLSKSIIPFSSKFSIVLILSFFAGIISYPNWSKVLQYLNQVQFSLQDPIFLRDVSFYVFSLPFFNFILNFLAGCLIFTIILVTLDYFQHFIISLFKPPTTSEIINSKNEFKLLSLKRNALIHLAVLGSFFFVLLAVSNYLRRFSIMYSEKGIVVGAGYADVNIFLPMIKVTMVLAVVVAILFYVWIFFFSGQKKVKIKHILIYGVIIYFLFFFIAPTILPEVVQSLKVSPNEINLEKPYIDNNIQFTKIAYGLEDVEEKEFNVNMNINQAVLENASETMDNIRILDWRPLTKTYKQTQEIRLYYDLSGIDIDRYTIDGKYTEVMLAPRELNQNQITENAKTWVNLHMVYTHGFGLVMSPVNSVTKQGLPNFLIQDIPPIYNFEDEKLKIDKPQIYYGEQKNGFVLTNTNTEEFDYPKGNTNEYIQYDGEGGVTLSSFTRKVLMAMRFGDIKILLSSDITPESKIMFDRNIQKRISKITPFLVLDEDPYLIINDGRLIWIQDAYTVTTNFPYSQKYGEINYIKNSVKIVIDAYDGDITYYITDPKDPLIVTYSNMFPSQFKSMKTMPEGIKEHIRYPQDLFKVQSTIYNTYHMNDTTVFYNKEDAWQVPYEVYGTGQQVQVEPYYIIIKLPGETKEEFVLMSSFTPIKKDNMIAWLAARSDGDNYGKLLLYKFPKDKLVYGPLQIEAKFDQDSEISEQLTLWSQQGSSVTRGNLLIIPIEDSILYIEPLYIQAETGQLPELKRILVSDGEKVVMEETLDIALEVLFGKAKAKQIEDTNEDVLDKTKEELIKEAQTYYAAIENSMGKSWIEFGENFDKLGKVLNKLE